MTTTFWCEDETRRPYTDLGRGAYRFNKNAQRIIRSTPPEIPKKRELRPNLCAR
jgi:hypothetical protein